MGSLGSQATTGSGSDSRFLALQQLPHDPIFAIDGAYKADPSEKKVNLGIGAYRDDEGNPWLLTSVREAKKKLSLVDSTHEYLPLHGLDGFLEKARELVFGSDLIKEIDDSLVSVQTISGSGANSVIARFLQTSSNSQPSTVWLPDPTWANHLQIWGDNAPSFRQQFYPYFNPALRGFDFAAMMDHLRQHAQQGDAILLQACAHNPTGSDPTLEQWREIASVCEDKGLFVVFDMAYQGFASGDLDKDAAAVRYFVTRPAIELAVCQSFSKNLGLYGERAGAIHILPSRASTVAASPAVIKGHLVSLQRADFSMPPRFGVSVAEKVLTDPELFAMWIDDLAVMSGRIKAMRQSLYDELVALKTPGEWSHIVEQNGMFCYTGLNKDQVARMMKEFHVYLLYSGRASISGLQSSNVKHVAQAIHSVVTTS